MLKPYIEQLMNRQHLSAQQSQAAIGHILTSPNRSQIAAFLALLRAKNETSQEIFGIANAMRASMVSVPVKKPVLDIVGTGGDGAHTVNISTGASILAASCGVPVAKHGNRSVSSRCGSADVLEALGINIQLGAEDVAACIEAVGIGFCFAPLFHPAMKHLKEIRTELGVATTFNIMGPLLNPARAEYCMIGVFREDLLERIADVLFHLKTKRSIVFHGAGLDEVSSLAPVKVIEISPKGQIAFELNPRDFGFATCELKDLQGGDAAENAAILRDAFEGKSSPVADTLIFNAGIALYLYGSVHSIKDGAEVARQQIESGQAKALLERFAEFSQRAGGQA